MRTTREIDRLSSDSKVSNAGNARAGWSNVSRLIQQAETNAKLSVAFSLFKKYLIAVKDRRPMIKPGIGFLKRNFPIYGIRGWLCSNALLSHIGRPGVKFTFGR